MTDETRGTTTGASRHPDRVLADYERTCEVITTLVDVRFRLAAFVPLLTGAAAVLITSDNLQLDPLDRGFLSVGGLLFLLGISMYDLRNTQHYNSAIGRAAFLETQLRLPKEPRDASVGVYGTRSDSKMNLEKKKKHRFGLGPTGHGLPIRHGTGLSLAYGAAIGAWVWALVSAVADGQGWTDQGRWLPIVAAVVAVAWYVREYRRIDPSD
ncbi:MAG: hypothetical protein OER95_03255 [Acidimicrobiia bacterium]|nr:hypothetical protein [Acidimicrobiia bacterium]